MEWLKVSWPKDWKQWIGLLVFVGECYLVISASVAFLCLIVRSLGYKDSWKELPWWIWTQLSTLDQRFLKLWRRPAKPVTYQDDAQRKALAAFMAAGDDFPDLARSKLCSEKSE
eukprot:gnl/TRDRNA2_/TRDRNA2_191068_c0_seq1.p1 gnl/TRDRNA2_/TRDRNA2_191068_c0~~gnl/TRDRNA2_/TRDRNA2_191068_c0_seq1.p1  ORF type:complete len:114 (+),score=19.34 gnl/TRDRNA2_/TRDRNA2_191068_c0_seq1:128-469(+)